MGYDPIFISRRPPASRSHRAVRARVEARLLCRPSVDAGASQPRRKQHRDLARGRLNRRCEAAGLVAKAERLLVSSDNLML